MSVDLGILGTQIPCLPIPAKALEFQLQTLMKITWRTGLPRGFYDGPAFISLRCKALGFKTLPSCVINSDHIWDLDPPFACI
jgi:hypothetical protein